MNFSFYRNFLNIRMKLFHKFLLGLALSSLLPVIWLGYFLIDRFQFSLETPISELHINLVENVKNRFELEMDKFDKRIYFMADILSKMDWTSRQAVLVSFMSSESLMNEISIGNPNGKEAFKVNLANEKSDELLDIAKEDYFVEAYASKSRAVKLLSGSDQIVLVYPFETFFIKAVLKKSDFFSAFNISNIGSSGVMVIVDSGKNVVSSSDDGHDADNAPSWSITDQALKNLSSAALSFKDSKGRDCLGAYAYIPSLKGAAIIKQNRTDAYSYALSMKKEAVIIVIVLAFFVMTAAYFISKNMSGPIMNITAAAKKISSGDFNHSVKVETNDELRDLADTFNDMIWQLKLYSEMQIEKILKERKNTQAVLFSTEDGIIMVDMQYNIELINRKAASILEIDGDSSQNKNFLSLIPNSSLKQVFYDLLSSKNFQIRPEFEIDHLNAKRVFAVSMKEMDLPDKGEKMGYLLAIYDITLAKELERIKEEFLHSITHDLRNPMSAIKGFVEFMLKEIPGPLNEAQKKMLVSMDRASFRLLAMINNILDIAKMEAGKMEINISQVDMLEVSKRAVDLMEALASRKKIEFQFLTDQSHILNADGQLMERVFINLIGNAIKFTPEKGKIIIGMRKERGYLFAWVEDTGDGIPQDYVDKVFEKFEQVKGQKAGGTGLGLTICKHITKAHMGDIWAEQDKGKGARFVFKVPVNLSKSEGRIEIDEKVLG